MGIVARTVKVFTGLMKSALTTARDNPARVNIRMNRIESEAISPARFPISSPAIRERLFPSNLTDAKSTTISWTAPATTAPIRIQIRPGRYPNWAARTGPISGPAPAIAAK